MLKASGGMAAATLLSRVLGLMREQAYMFFLGTTWVNDAFQYAFTIPNLFRRLLGEGALTAAFIPIFKEKEKAAGKIEMWQAANAVISGLLVAASGLVAVVLLLVSLALAFGTPAEFSAPATSTLHETISAISTNVVVAAAPVHFWTPGQTSSNSRLIVSDSGSRALPLSGSNSSIASPTSSSAKVAWGIN